MTNGDTKGNGGRYPRRGARGYARRMRRSFLLALGLVPAAPLAFASCSPEDAVPIGLVMVAPQAIQDAESVELLVFPAGDVACNPDGSLGGAVPEKAARFQLQKEGCDEGLAWCAEIEVERTDDPTMFAAVAKSQGQTTLQGCTVTPVNQDPLEVTIEMQQFLEPPCCGDGKLQTFEQCDPGGLASCGEIQPDEVCFANCTSAEVLLSNPAPSGVKPGLANVPRTKSQLAMAFCPGNAQIGTALRAVFRSTGEDGKANGDSDINLRVMSPDGYTITEPVPLSQQLRLPLPCWNTYAPAAAGAEQSPAIAPVSQSSTLVVYASNVQLMSSSDVFVVEQSEDVCADVPLNQDPAVQVSKTESAPGAITPDVARGPEGTALIVWDQKGQIVGRLWKDGVLSPDVTAPPIGIGAGALPKVAGNAAGWVVVYQGGSPGSEDVLKRSVDLNGVPGPEETVNGVAAGAQVKPDVAMLDDGSYAVVWESGGDIYFQRYTSAGPVSGDQDAPLNDDGGDGAQANPTVAAPLTGGAFFAAAWEDTGGIVTARYLGEKGGFLFNGHDGRSTSFPASHLGIQGQRHSPAIAIGNYVMFGWQDDSDEHPGVYIRRFQLPK